MHSAFCACIVYLHCFSNSSCPPIANILRSVLRAINLSHHENRFFSVSHLLHIKEKPVTVRQQGECQFHENRTIWFSSKNTSKNIILLGFTGCTYTVIWCPAAAHGGSTCHKALLNIRDVGLSSMSIPLHRDHQNIQQWNVPNNTENAPKNAK